MTREQEKQITELVERAGPQLYALAYRITGNKTSAEDMVQNAFAVLCENIDILSRHENLRGWLYRTTYFYSIREIQRAYHRRNVPLEPEEVEGVPGIAEPLELYLPRELKPHEREIILLRLEQCLDYEEIAAQKGMTVEACRQSYSRAIRKCRKLCLEEEKKPASAKKE